MLAKIQMRRDSAANWTTANTVLASGEIGAELDSNPIRFKIGNGVTAWNDLPYDTSTGTVLSVAVATANGISGTVSNPTTNPVITLVLGGISPTSVSASGSVTGSNLSGTNTGDQTITLTGDLTGSGTGTFAATIVDHAVTNAKLAQIPAQRIKGNNTGLTANALDLTGTEVTAMLDAFTNIKQGVVPLSGGGTSNFLRADGSWASPVGAGTVTSVDVSGGSTGLTTSGGPITGSGTITLAGTANVTHGGTGTATQFTPGSIVFAGTNGIYSQDNANLFWDNTNKILEPKNCAVNTTDLSEIIASGGNCIFAVGNGGASRIGYQPNFSGFLAVTNGTVSGYVAHPAGGTDGLAVGTASSDNFTIRLGNANRAQFQVNGGFWTASYAISLGSLSSSHMVTGVLSNNSTSVVNDVFCCRFDGAAGAASNGIGAGLTFRVNTSTTFAIDSGQVASGWSTVTHASRIGFLTLSAYDAAAAREGLRISTSGSAAQISFLGASPVVKQASGADLTNSVTAGGTTDTIANYTDLTIYANDAAAIRNDIYQLARKLKQVNDALRLYGLLT